MKNKLKITLLLSLAILTVIGMTACKKDKADENSNQSGTIDIPDDMEKTPSYELSAQSEEYQDIISYKGLDPEKTYTVIARISEKEKKTETPKYYTEAEFQPEEEDGTFIMNLSANMTNDKEYTCLTTLTEKGSSEPIEFEREKILGQDGVEFK